MTNPVLTIANLTKRFGGVTAVSDINLDVMPKETIAIIGPNGAGKTTFYNMVSGRMQPTEGTIMLDGKDITGLPPHKISRLGVSRSFQINNIFPEMTVQENVEVVLSAYHGHSRKLFNIASRNTAIQHEAVGFLKRLGIDSLKATCRSDQLRRQAIAGDRHGAGNTTQAGTAGRANSRDDSG